MRLSIRQPPYPARWFPACYSRGRRPGTPFTHTLGQSSAATGGMLSGAPLITPPGPASWPNKCSCWRTTAGSCPEGGAPAGMLKITYLESIGYFHMLHSTCGRQGWGRLFPKRSSPDFSAWATFASVFLCFFLFLSSPGAALAVPSCPGSKSWRFHRVPASARCCTGPVLPMGRPLGSLGHVYQGRFLSPYNQLQSATM